MGSLVHGFEHDVFLSYSTVDDRPSQNGWVTAFNRHLRESLAANFGSRDPERIWWDRSNIDEEQSLSEQIAVKVQKSACLIVILSRGYVASKWCRAELDAFLQAAHDHAVDSRIFLIDIGNLAEARRPKEFCDIRGRHFWVQPSWSDLPDDRQTLGAPVPRPDQPDYPMFYSAVEDLARAVHRRIEKLAASAAVSVSQVQLKIAESSTKVEIKTGDEAGPQISNPSGVETTVVKKAEVEPSIERINKADEHYWESGDFAVTVLVACKSPNDESQLRSFAEAGTKPVPVFSCGSSDILSAGMTEQFRFEFRFVRPDSLAAEAQRFRSQSASRFLVVVSDALVSPSGAPEAVAHEIRSMFSGPDESYVGLIGLSQNRAGRVRDLDRILDARVLAESSFLRELSRTADGLRMKAPTGRTLTAVDPVQVRLVQSKEEMRKSLHLRHLVYDRMSYLNDAISQHPSELELDCFDLFDADNGTGAVHFIAWSQSVGDIVGAARLIVPRAFEFASSMFVLGDPAEQILRRQAEWIQQVVADHDAEKVLHRSLTRRTFNRMPVLQSANIQDVSLLRGIGLAEISRVIVAPRYRGCGLGRLLVRALVAASLDLNKPNVVLECIPAHVAMYKKFGFQVIEGAQGRDESLDQEAVAMILQQPGSFAKAHSVARNDLKMISRDDKPFGSLADSGYLCLCSQRECWEDGHYTLRNNHVKCPLKCGSKVAAAESRQNSSIVQ